GQTCLHTATVTAPTWQSMIRRTRVIVDSCARNLVHPIGSLTVSPVPPRLQAWAMNSGLEDGIFMAHSWLTISSAPYLQLTWPQLHYGVRETRSAKSFGIVTAR